MKLILVNEALLRCRIRIDESALVVVSVVEKVTDVVGAVAQMLLRDRHKSHGLAAVYWPQNLQLS